MDSRTYFIYIIQFIVFFLLQVLIVRNLVLFDKAFAFVYLAFILFLPHETSTPWAMVIAFLSGLAIDIFYDSMGMHAAACVFVAFIRKSWLELLTPRGGYDLSGAISISVLGFRWYLAYAAPLVFIHHLILFFIEAGSATLWWLTFQKAFFSSIFTLILIGVIQLFFYGSRRRI